MEKEKINTSCIFSLKLYVKNEVFEKTILEKNSLLKKK